MSTQKSIHPERQKRVRSALTIFSALAFITGFFLLFLVGRMISEYILGLEIPVWARYIGVAHGWVYAGFVLSVINLGLKARWEPMKWLSTALSGVVPFFSFWMEAKRRKEITAEFQLADVR
ncbi:DUF3817 domain-containing protein [Corynebacterium pseudodiphtheriticum]|uniref:DUF3817 domain-containing protein n=1 Tax=Corynebacterium pseudodiphtheriticum TaxID=37637 RepID=UPI00254CB41A|nr:DUF3817 domain-containing protein [Corynebacterium pseudodiphtheriticum]MDK8683887.1 DUF3817 domain-containing protein [Corynebacterium pseudodiphtheriticum]